MAGLESSATPRAPPGELRGLVAAYLAAYPAEDFGPHAPGRVLGGSNGAVANALDRLTALGQAQLAALGGTPCRPVGHRKLTRAQERLAGA